MFLEARDSVTSDLPILLHSGDFDLIRTEEWVLQDGFYFSSSKTAKQDLAALYNALRDLIDNGGGPASKLGIPSTDVDRSRLDEWYPFTQPRNYKFKAAPPYKVKDKVIATYYWIWRDEGLPRYPKVQ